MFTNKYLTNSNMQIVDNTLTTILINTVSAFGHFHNSQYITVSKNLSLAFFDWYTFEVWRVYRIKKSFLNLYISATHYTGSLIVFCIMDTQFLSCMNYSFNSFFLYSNHNVIESYGRPLYYFRNHKIKDSVNSFRLSKFRVQNR